MERSNVRNYLSFEETEASLRTMRTIHSFDEIYKTYVPQTVARQVISSPTSSSQNHKTENGMSPSCIGAQSPNLAPLVSSTTLQNYDISAPRAQFYNNFNDDPYSMACDHPSTTTFKYLPQEEVYRIASGEIHKQGGYGLSFESTDKGGSSSCAGPSNNGAFAPPEMANGTYYDQGPSYANYSGYPGYCGYPECYCYPECCGQPVGCCGQDCGCCTFQNTAILDQYQDQQYPLDQGIDICYCQQAKIPSVQALPVPEAQEKSCRGSGSQDKSVTFSCDLYSERFSQEDIRGTPSTSVCPSQETKYYDREDASTDCTSGVSTQRSSNTRFSEAGFSAASAPSFPLCSLDPSSCCSPLQSNCTDIEGSMRTQEQDVCPSMAPCSKPYPAVRKVRIETVSAGSASCAASEGCASGAPTQRSTNTRFSEAGSSAVSAPSFPLCSLDPSSCCSPLQSNCTDIEGSMRDQQQDVCPPCGRPYPAVRKVRIGTVSAGSASCASQGCASGAPTQRSSNTRFSEANSSAASAPSFPLCSLDPSSCCSPLQSNCTDIEGLMRAQQQDVCPPCDKPYPEVRKVRIETVSAGSASCAASEGCASGAPTQRSTNTRFSEAGSSAVSAPSFPLCSLDPSSCCSPLQSNCTDIEGSMRTQQQDVCPPCNKPYPEVRKVRIETVSAGSASRASEGCSQVTVPSMNTENSACCCLDKRYSDVTLKMPDPDPDSEVCTICTGTVNTGSASRASEDCSLKTTPSWSSKFSLCSCLDSSLMPDPVRIETCSYCPPSAASECCSQEAIPSKNSDSSGCNCLEEKYSDRAFKMPDPEPEVRIESCTDCSPCGACSQESHFRSTGECTSSFQQCSVDGSLSDPCPCCFPPQSNCVDIDGFLRAQQCCNNCNQCQCQAYVNDVIQSETVYTTDYRPIMCLGNQYRGMGSGNCRCQDMPLGGGCGPCYSCPPIFCPSPCSPCGPCCPPSCNSNPSCLPACGPSACCPPPCGPSPCCPPSCGPNPCCPPCGSNSCCPPCGSNSCCPPSFDSNPCCPPPCGPSTFCFPTNPPCCGGGLNGGMCGGQSTGIFTISDPCSMSTPCCYPLGPLLSSGYPCI